MNEYCTRCGAPYREDDAFCGKCGAPRAASPATPAQQPQYRLAAPGERQPKSKPIKAFPLVLGLLLPLVIGGVMFFAMGDCGSTEGNMAVNGPRGTFTFTPTGCASMQPYGRFGANLHGNGPNDGAVYVTIDHTSGTLVEIEIPGSCQNENGTDCTVFAVPRDRCTAYEANVENTGTVVNDVRLVEGRVRLDCVLEDGTEVKGTIVFDGC